MTLVVEDGTGKPDADSYVARADADAFWESRGEPGWAEAAAAAREAALRAATEYLDASYRWVGTPMDDDQALGWPRYGAVDREGISVDSAIVPAPVRKAACHLALAALSAPLLAPEDADSRVKRRRDKVDVIETETEYHAGTSSRRRFPLVDRLLDGLCRGNAGGLVGSRVRA